MGPRMRPKKRSFTIAGHRTSISVEEEFWLALREIAAREGVSVAQLVARIDGVRGGANLSSAIRVYILRQFRSAASASTTALKDAATPVVRPGSR